MEPTVPCAQKTYRRRQNIWTDGTDDASDIDTFVPFFRLAVNGVGSAPVFDKRSPRRAVTIGQERG